MLVNVSWLSEYIWCARKLFLNKVLGIREPFREAPVKGIVQHMMYDRIRKIDEALIKGISADDNADSIRERFEHAYSRALWDIAAANKYELREAGIEIATLMQQLLPRFKYDGLQKAMDIWSFIKIHKVYGDELWNMMPKAISELTLTSDALGLKGKVDRIEQNNGNYVPVELKSGSVPREGVWEGHRIQLGAYSMLVEEHFKVPVKEGVIVYLNTGERRSVVMNPFLRDEVKGIRDAVCDVLSGSEAPKLCEKEICVKCPLRNICFDEKYIKEKQKSIKQKL